MGARPLYAHPRRDHPDGVWVLVGAARSSRRSPSSSSPDSVQLRSHHGRRNAAGGPALPRRDAACRHQRGDRPHRVLPLQAARSGNGADARGPSTAGVGGIFAGGNSGSIIVQLVPIEKRKGVFQLIPAYRGQLVTLFRAGLPPRCASAPAAGSAASGPRSSFQSWPSLTALTDGNNKIIQNLQTNPYVVDVGSSLSDTSLENDFVPDTARLKGTGITRQRSPGAADLRIGNTGLQRGHRGPQLSHPGPGGPDGSSGRQSLLNLPIYLPRCRPRSRSASWGVHVERGAGEPEPIQPAVHRLARHQPEARTRLPPWR